MSQAAKVWRKIVKCWFSQSRYSPQGSGSWVGDLECGHQNIRKWSQRPKGDRIPCDYCKKEEVS